MGEPVRRRVRPAGPRGLTIWQVVEDLGRFADQRAMAARDRVPAFRVVANDRDLRFLAGRSLFLWLVNDQPLSRRWVEAEQPRPLYE